MHDVRPRYFLDEQTIECRIPGNEGSPMLTESYPHSIVEELVDDV